LSCEHIINNRNRSGRSTTKILKITPPFYGVHKFKQTSLQHHNVEFSKRHQALKIYTDNSGRRSQYGSPHVIMVSSSRSSGKRQNDFTAMAASACQYGGPPIIPL
jgi:hypothetical protein